MITGKRSRYERRLRDLKSEAQKWDVSWKDIRDYVAPTRGYFDDNPNDGKEVDHQRFIDDEAERANDNLANGLSSGLTDPSRPWFKLKAPAPIASRRDVLEWVADAEQIMRDLLLKSNFYDSTNLVFKELGAFGTACVIQLEDYESVFRFRTFTIGEYFLGAGADGRINSFARTYQMTVSQLVEEFGEENVSDTVRESFQRGEVDGWVTVNHVIVPNPQRREGKLDVSGKAFHSCYWEHNSPSDTFLRISGFEEFPIHAPRWETKTTSCIYGRGPGSKQLGNSKQLQKMVFDKLVMFDKTVDPPVQVNGEIEDVNTMPGGVSRSSALVKDSGVRAAYQISADFAAINDTIDRCKSDIKEGFFTDLFRAILELKGSTRSAEEIASRFKEKLFLLGPLLNRLHGEYLIPALERSFAITYRLGLLPPVPPVLEGQELKIEFISMLAQAQKELAIGPMERTVATAVNLAKDVPGILDNIDFDKFIVEHADLSGAPPKIIKDPAEVARIRAQRAQQEMAAQLGAGAEVIAKSAKELSQAKLNQGSVLDAVTGG